MPRIHGRFCSTDLNNQPRISEHPTCNRACDKKHEELSK